MASDTACNAYIQVPILPIDAFHDALYVSMPGGAFGVLLQQCVRARQRHMHTTPPRERRSASMMDVHKWSPTCLSCAPVWLEARQGHCGDASTRQVRRTTQLQLPRAPAG